MFKRVFPWCFPWWNQLVRCWGRWGENIKRTTLSSQDIIGTSYLKKPTKYSCMVYRKPPGWIVQVYFPHIFSNEAIVWSVWINNGFHVKHFEFLLLKVLKSLYNPRNFHNDLLLWIAIKTKDLPFVNYTRTPTILTITSSLSSFIFFSLIVKYLKI